MGEMDGNTPFSLCSVWSYVPSWPEVLHDFISHGMNPMHERPLQPLQVKIKNPFLSIIWGLGICHAHTSLRVTQSETEHSTASSEEAGRLI